MAKTIFATAPDMNSARTIVTELVSKNLIACGSIIPGVESIYHWQGNIETSNEVQLILKTNASVTEVQEAFTSLHPYEVPEFIVVEISDGLPAYLDWVRDVSKPPTNE